MIEINLLPGARKKAKRSSGPSFDLAGAFKDLGSHVNDPWLIAAVGGVVVGVLAIGLMWTIQSRQESSLTEREQKAVQDSTRYASVIAERTRAEAQRDSVKKQIAVISAIDGARLVWPHVMDEISRALPPYVWLRGMTSTPIPAEAPEVQAGVTASPKKNAKGAPTPADEGILAIQLTGNTVAIQALTGFIRALEASPFLQNVQLVRSDVVMQQGKEATEFRLDMQYQKPDASVLRTVPFTVTVR